MTFQSKINHALKMSHEITINLACRYSLLYIKDSIYNVYHT